MKAILIKREDGYNLGIEQPQGRLLEATCSPSQQLILNKSGASTKYKLSKQNCDEIFGVIDSFYESISKLNTSYLKGFNKAMELNKDKQFTLEDMRTAMTYGIVQEGTGFVGIHSVDDLFNLILKKVSQPTEIEVEVEMEEYGYCGGCRRAGMWHCAHADTCGNAETRERPKLDADGCLILKKL
jgi:hypothetical protein